MQTWTTPVALLVLCCGFVAPAVQAQGVPIGASPSFSIVQEATVSSDDLGHLTRTLTSALAYLQRECAPLRRSVKVRIGGGALRPGYSPKTDEIVFCNSKDVAEMGLRSVDVINHELFHAFASQFLPQAGDTPMDEDTEALHEALADFFAYEMVPDRYFGEGYSTTRPWLREYQTPLCFSLAAGPHAKGSALCNHLIECGYTLRELGIFLQTLPFERSALLGLRKTLSSCFDPAKHPDVAIESTNYPVSRLGKYALTQQLPLVLTFKANELFLQEYPVLDVAWEGEELAKLLDVLRLDSPAGTVSFRLAPKAGSGMLKVIARVLAGKATVGLFAFYFRIAK